MQVGVRLVNHQARQLVGVEQRPAVFDEADRHGTRCPGSAPLFHQDDSLRRVDHAVFQDVIKRRRLAPVRRVVDFEDRSGRGNRGAVRAGDNEDRAGPGAEIGGRGDFELGVREHLEPGLLTRPSGAE